MTEDEKQELRFLDNLVASKHVSKLLYCFTIRHQADPRGTHMVLVTECNSSVDLSELKLWMRDTAKLPVFPDYIIPPLLLQILKGVEYLHSLELVHLDLRPENIMINGETGLTQICDFGRHVRMHGKFFTS